MTPVRVVDASSTLTWLLNESGQAASLVLRFGAADLFAPPLWRLEVLNVLLKRSRQKKDTAQETITALQSLEDLGVVLEEPNDGLDAAGVFRAAAKHQLSAYDGEYLRLARRLGCPLITHDRNLRLAAEAEGVELL